MSHQESQQGQQWLLPVLFKDSRSGTQQMCLFSLYLALKQTHGTHKTPVPTFKQSFPGNSLVVQCLGFSTLTARAQFQSLVGELRSCKPCNPPKNILPWWCRKLWWRENAEREPPMECLPCLGTWLVSLFLLLYSANFKSVGKTCNFPQIFLCVC